MIVYEHALPIIYREPILTSENTIEELTKIAFQLKEYDQEECKKCKKRTIKINNRIGDKNETEEKCEQCVRRNSHGHKIKNKTTANQGGEDSHI